MKLKNLKKQDGFTIIEVLIVLAIAGLIMLVVFLAVPALQRNSRNTQRTNDASRVAAAITECMNNNNGVIGSCNNLAATQLTNYITVANNQQLNQVLTTADPNPASTPPQVNHLRLEFGTQCNTSGTDNVTGGGTRAFTLLYLIETNGVPQLRCLAS